MAEKIFLNADYKVIRAGNVIGSSGSVIPLFRKQIDEGIPVTLTHRGMTRFFMTLNEAINLVLDAYKLCKPGNTMIIPMKSFKLTDVIKAMSGRNDYPTTIIGIRPGEKLHENLLNNGEFSSKNTENDLRILVELLRNAGYLNS